MRAPLTKRELDAMKCSEPGCTNCQAEIYMKAACHPDAGLAAFYNKRTGCVTLECFQCARPIRVIEVAAGTILN